MRYNRFKTKLENIKQYKDQLKKNLKETLSQVELENKLIYQLEKTKEKERMAKIRSFRITREAMGQLNYEEKVKRELELVNKVKSEIAILGQKEQETMDRLLLTQEALKTKATS
jgi:hypothetical protein